MAERISIIDDNINLVTSLALQLKSRGYTVSSFTCPKQALDFHSQKPADFYIIDIKMPKISGITFYKELCHKLGEEKLPALFLTAVNELEIQCLEETSISDFVKKPFSFEILNARIKKILSYFDPISEEKTYKIGNLILNEEKIMCQWFTHEIILTKTEFLLISYLAKRPRTIFSRPQLLDLLEKNLEVEERVIDSHVKRIRKKFKKAHPKEKFDRIHTHYASGYAWHPKSISI